MKRIVLSAVVGVFAAALAGCGNSSDGKQPKLAGTPDPKITGPATPGGGGKAGGGNPAPQSN